MNLVQGFYPLKIKITQFPDGFHVNNVHISWLSFCQGCALKEIILMIPSALNLWNQGAQRYIFYEENKTFTLPGSKSEVPGAPGPC